MSDNSTGQPAKRRTTPEEVAAVDAMRPIFIVGCGHSGTTLLAAMLDSHPRMRAYPGESNVFRYPNPLGRFHLLTALAASARQDGCTTIVEKTPRHIHVVDRILETLPSARIVYAVRDGRDVACSLARRVGYIQHGIDRWLEDNQAGLAALAAHPGRVHLLRYEELIDDPEAALRRLCDVLGEPFDPAMLRYHEIERNWFGTQERFTGDRAYEPGLDKKARDARHLGRRNHQINTPIFDPRGEWRGLPLEDQARLTEALRPMLERLGYLHAD